MDHYLGIDLGTSGLKAAVIGEDGITVATSEASYSVSGQHAGWAETEPTQWVAALRSAVDSLGSAPSRVRAAGIAGQMHGAVLCDRAGRALRPAILWPDRRAVVETEHWHRLPSTVRARLANPIVPGMTGPILRWLSDHEPATLADAAKVLLPKDYLRVSVGGSLVTDRSDASATLLWNLPGDSWLSSTLDVLGVPPRLLPEVRRPEARDGVVTLPGPLHGVPLVVGCADTAAALLASRLGPSEVQVNLGTGIQVLRAVGEPWARADPPVHLYADAADGWYAMAAVRNGGLALDWVRQLFAMTWSEVFASAGTSSAGGVSFLPFLTGERGGVAPATAQGAWIGMTERTRRENLVRAAVEGLAFCVRRAVSLLQSEGSPVRVSGGGARSPVLRQLVADVLGVPLAYAQVRSASAAGAAMLAARGVGGRIAPVPGSDPAARDRAPVTVSPRPFPGLDDAYHSWLARLSAN